MSDQVPLSTLRLRWVVRILALASVLYLGAVVWSLFQEANMAFGLVESQRQGIEQLLTAREYSARANDSVVTARQLSAILSIAEEVTALPPGPNLNLRTRDVLVRILNATSMTLSEYRAVRTTIHEMLITSSQRQKLDSLSQDRFDIVLPRLRRVRSFFTEHKDSIGLASAF